MTHVRSVGTPFGRRSDAVRSRKGKLALSVVCAVLVWTQAVESAPVDLPDETVDATAEVEPRFSSIIEAYMPASEMTGPFFDWLFEWEMDIYHRVVGSFLRYVTDYAFNAAVLRNAASRDGVEGDAIF
ncbi:unnamed protein product [Darwinula stevensoni]|uniref:Uncharacterized protein n=1 Tax=Darwinula stevensoni TaxID=69355 RepID=A0A7R9AD69_9CRUS|nr:unnamed protein product [Darwinula stevensoni]CAG0901023.1 unnamed protein product [Darwinula stevensoni]